MYPSDASNAPPGLMSPMFSLVLALVIYAVYAYPLYVMGQKTNSQHSWFAFVPILNMVLLLEIAGKDLWWILLFFIPCVNIIIAIIVWMAVAEAMNKPSWVGALMIIPGVNFVLPFYIALA